MQNIQPFSCSQRTKLLKKGNILSVNTGIKKTNRNQSITSSLVPHANLEQQVTKLQKGGKNGSKNPRYAGKAKQRKKVSLLGGRSTIEKKGLLKQRIPQVGEICNLVVTALGPKNVGIDEFSYGYAQHILIPNAKLGQKVKAQIIKINLNKAKYAVAKIISISETKSSPALISPPSLSEGKDLILPNVGDILTVKLNKIAVQTDNSFIGIVNSDLKLPTKYQLIIPVNNQTKVGQEIQIQITKLKLKYGFAKVVSSNPSLRSAKPIAVGNYIKNTSVTGFSSDKSPGRVSGELDNKVSNDFSVQKIVKGSKITLTLPKTAKKYAKYLVMRYNSHILFINNSLEAKLGEKVLAKLTKIGSSFAIGKVIRISPNSSQTRFALVRKNLNEMLVNGMHYGEKVVKCQAKMRNFIWNSTRSVIKSKVNNNSSNGVKQTVFSPKLDQNQSLNKGVRSALIKKGRHLINLLKTRRCLNIALRELTKYAAKGRTFLFVGTKKPAAGLIARAALFSKTSFFVNTRWLGGMLTNWKTIIKSISKIRPILKEKQKVISNILQKRSKIQNRLIKKVLSLRKKSKILIKKGKQLIAKVKISNTNSLTTQEWQSHTKEALEGYSFSNKINIKKKELFERGQFLLKKRQNLLNKQNELFAKTLTIKENGFLIVNKYKASETKLKTTYAKLHDLRLLFLLNNSIRKIQKLAKEQGKKKFILSFDQLKQLSALAEPPLTLENDLETTLEHKRSNSGSINSKHFWLVPNPPQDILNKLLTFVTTNNSVSKAPLPGIATKTIIKKNKTSYLNTDINSFTRISTTLNNNFSIKEKNTTGNLNDTNSSINVASPMISRTGAVGSIRNGLILTKLLSKFSRFLPLIKNNVNIMLRIIQNIEKKITELKSKLKALKNTLTDYLFLNNSLNSELELIKTKYLSEQQIIRVLRRKLKRHEAEKKLLQFLPKLRYLPTPKNQISVAVQLLMKRFVDPKMKYPLDLIYDEKLRKKSKKVAAARKKKWQRLETYFGGIANMTKLKKTQISKNVAIIIGQQEEINAIRECKKMGIKMFHIVDTNCNPGLADHFIPANDDSRNSIKYLLSKMVTRIRLAQKIRLRLKKKAN